MKNLLIITIVGLFAYSCNKLNSNNIRGNWEVERYVVNNADSTPNVPTYFTFNEGGEGIYFENNGTGIGYLFNWSLDEKSQILTYLDFYGDTINGPFPVPFNVEKKGKRMTLTYSNGSTTLKYELIQAYLEF